MNSQRHTQDSAAPKFATGAENDEAGLESEHPRRQKVSQFVQYNDERLHEEGGNDEIRNMSLGVGLHAHNQKHWHCNYAKQTKEES